MISTISIIGMLSFGKPTATYTCNARTLFTINPGDTTSLTYNINSEDVAIYDDRIEFTSNRSTKKFNISLKLDDGRFYAYLNETQYSYIFYVDDASGLIVSYSPDADITPSYPKLVMMQHCRKLND